VKYNTFMVVLVSGLNENARIAVKFLLLMRKQNELCTNNLYSGGNDRTKFVLDGAGARLALFDHILFVGAVSVGSKIVGYYC
jgi:hypothetical protein